jgi:hypothetical protein
LDRRLGGPQNWFEHNGKKKNSHPLPGLKPPHFIKTLYIIYDGGGGGGTMVLPVFI